MEATKLGYLGIDQYNKHYKIDKSPRKELLEQLGRQHTSKMYVDLKSGGSRHVGYVIAGKWISIYEVHIWNS